jgi:exopolysaccharide biosynthesis polyprenyl glycosylphosphotransferase
LQSTFFLLLFGGAIRSEGVLRRMAKRPPVTDDEPSSGIESELLALAHRAASAGLELAPSEEAPPVHRAHSRDWILRRALVAADLLGCAAALLLARLTFVSDEPTRDLRLIALMLAGLAGWVVLAQMLGLYECPSSFGTRSTADDFPPIIVLSTLATWLGMLALAATGFAHPTLKASAVFWVAAIAFVTAGRGLARFSVERLSETREPTLILGSGRVAGHIASKLASRPWYGLDVIGFVDDDPMLTDTDIPPYLGPTSKLEAVIGAHQIEHVVLAFSRMPVDEQVELSRRCLELDVQVDIVPRMFEVIGSRNRLHDLDGLPLVQLQRARLSRSSRLLKRCLDLVIGSAVLVLASPFIAYAAVRIKLQSPGPVFFRQERMGMGGRRFQILKFRTMYADAEARKAELAHLNRHTEDGPRMFKIENDPRITPFGHFLRRWSLDELPQLINVLRGEMSLVGPRPLILDEDVNITGLQRRRLQLLPGITGLWQVLGRSDIPFTEMVTLDHLYVTNWSLWGDVKLLVRTMSVVLARRGAY